LWQQCLGEKEETRIVDCFRAANTGDAQVLAHKRTENQGPQQSSARFKETEDDFGRDKSKVEPLAFIVAKVEKIEKNRQGKRLFTLDNGQLWAETDRDRLRIRKGQQVIIERGAFGSYNLKREGAKRFIKVMRRR
jgi:hypothetical protein